MKAEPTEALTSNELVSELRDEEEWASWPMRLALRRRAADEIERLTRERDDYCRQLTAGIPQMREVCNERDRLRASLERIGQDEFSDAYESCDDGQNDYWRVVNIAREALSGASSAVETNAALGATQERGLSSPDQALGRPVEPSRPPELRRQTTKALRECGEWLSECLRIGWPKSSLDRLQDIWWEFHDDHGRLLNSALKASDE